MTELPSPRQEERSLDTPKTDLGAPGTPAPLDMPGRQGDGHFAQPEKGLASAVLPRRSQAVLPLLPVSVAEAISSEVAASSLTDAPPPSGSDGFPRDSTTDKIVSPASLIKTTDEIGSDAGGETRDPLKGENRRTDPPSDIGEADDVTGSFPADAGDGRGDGGRNGRTAVGGADDGRDGQSDQPEGGDAREEVIPSRTVFSAHERQAQPDSEEVGEEELLKTEKFRIVTSSDVDPMILEVLSENVADYSNELKELIKGRELKKSWKRRRQLRAMVAAFVTYAREELGIDVSATVPQDVNEFHFFDNKAYPEIISDGGFSEEVVGDATVDAISGDIVVLEQSTVNQTLKNSNHELIHRVGTTQVRIVEHPDRDPVIFFENGYQTGDSEDREKSSDFHMLTELLTEITEMEEHALYWPRYPVLAKVIKYPEVGYGESLILGDELIRKVAEHNGVDYQAVLRRLQRGLLLHKDDELEVLTDVIGEEGMDILREWRVVATDTVEIAQKLNLPEAERKIRALRAGEGATFFEGYGNGSSITIG